MILIHSAQKHLLITSNYRTTFRVILCKNSARRLISVYSAAGTLTATEQDRFRIPASGALTPVSTHMEYADTSTVHLRLTF